MLYSLGGGRYGYFPEEHVTTTRISMFAWAPGTKKLLPRAGNCQILRLKGYYMYMYPPPHQLMSQLVFVPVLSGLLV